MDMARPRMALHYPCHALIYYGYGSAQNGPALSFLCVDLLWIWHGPWPARFMVWQYDCMLLWLGPLASDYIL